MMFIKFNVDEAAVPPPRKAQGTHTSVQQQLEHDKAYNMEAKLMIVARDGFGERTFWQLEIRPQAAHLVEEQTMVVPKDRVV